MEGLSLRISWGLSSEQFDSKKRPFSHFVLLTLHLISNIFSWNHVSPPPTQRGRDICLPSPYYRLWLIVDAHYTHFYYTSADPFKTRCKYISSPGSLFPRRLLSILCFNTLYKPLGTLRKPPILRFFCYSRLLFTPTLKIRW